MPGTNKISPSLNFALGITDIKGEAIFVYRKTAQKTASISFDKSPNGTDFGNYLDKISLVDEKGKKINGQKISCLKLSQADNKYLMTYVFQSTKKASLQVAVSEDLLKWVKKGTVPAVDKPGVFVAGYKFRGDYILYYGGKSIKLVATKDLSKFRVEENSLLFPSFGREIIIGNAILTDNGIIVLYFEKIKEATGKTRQAIFAALFDKFNPGKLLWKGDVSVWEEPQNWGTQEAMPVGIINFKGNLISYWERIGKGVYAVMHTPLDKVYNRPSGYNFSILKRLKENPILKPITRHFWENKATFNPAAIYAEGKVHLVYRAIGESDLSVLGYANSHDGVHIDERLADPIYTPTQPFEFSASNTVGQISPYASGGGGYGGCEDPRITKVGDKYYMTYVAYDGTNPPRVALTKISVSDFHSRNFDRWDTPVLISPPGVVDKNCVIFPEKINGKYCLLHRVFPNILVDYVDDLDAFDGKTFLKGEYKIKPRITSWDSRKIGAGAPPLKTDSGWLLIYHSVGDQDPSRYKMGAMLLDQNNPTKVTARTNFPILCPQAHYENEGMKSGVAYPCGAVTFDDRLLVYYGGADMVVCAAQTRLSSFLDELMTRGSTKFEEVEIRKIKN